MPEEKKLSPEPEKIETYTISIKGGDTDRTIQLSSKMFRLGVGSVVAAGVLLVGTAAFSFYSAMRMQRDASTIQEIEQACRRTTTCSTRATCTRTGATYNATC